jgi:hypothetical protein
VPPCPDSDGHPISPEMRDAISCIAGRSEYTEGVVLQKLIEEASLFFQSPGWE